jgi:hypothetical protein
MGMCTMILGCQYHHSERIIGNDKKLPNRDFNGAFLHTVKMQL